MNPPDAAALLNRTRTELSRHIGLLRQPEPGAPVIAIALAAARLAEDVACGEAFLGQGNVPESLSRAASFYRLALLTLLSREDRRTVHYQVDGAEVTATVERPRDGIGFEPVAEGILCCWSAGEFDTAAAIGSLPTQLYRPEGKRTPHEALMFWTFSLASVARGNLQAFARAAEHLRESAGTAGPEVRTWAAGYALPGTAALEAVLAGKQRVAARHLVKMLRYHRWRTRDGGLSSGLDIGTSGLVCFARSRGVLLEIADPLLAEPGERNLHPTTS